MRKLLSLARIFSDTVFGSVLPPIQWTTRDHLLMAGLATFGFLVSAMCCVLSLLLHRHDYLMVLKCGAGAVVSGLIALHSWNQWLVKRRDV